MRESIFSDVANIKSNIETAKANIIANAKQISDYISNGGKKNDNFARVLIDGIIYGANFIRESEIVLHAKETELNHALHNKYIAVIVDLSETAKTINANAKHR